MANDVQQFAIEIQALYDYVLSCIDQTPLPATEEKRDVYSVYEKLTPQESQPYLRLFNRLQDLLDKEILSGFIHRYMKLQREGNLNFTDTIPVRDDCSDFYREIQALDGEQTKTVIQLKCLLKAKLDLDLIPFKNAFPNENAFKMRQLKKIIDNWPESRFTALAKEYHEKKGVCLKKSPEPNTATQCAALDFGEIVLDKKPTPEAVDLYRTAVAETNATMSLPPLLHHDIPLIQSINQQEYIAKFCATLKKVPEAQHYNILSTTDHSFNQIALSAAVSLDNTNAALALIQIINTLPSLTLIEKWILLNKRSINKLEGWDEAIYSATPLLLAIQRGNKAVVQALLESPYIDPNKADLKHLTPLDWAFVMADANMMRQLIAYGADPGRAYYRTHAWESKIWQPSDNPLAQVFHINKEYVGDHPEISQLNAHYWDATAKFFQMRYYNPQVAICETLMSVPYRLENGGASQENLPEVFRDHFQKHIDAIEQRRKLLAASNEGADIMLANKLTTFITEFQLETNIFWSQLHQINNLPQKKERLQKWKAFVQSTALELQQDIQQKYPAHRCLIRDNVILIINKCTEMLIKIYSQLEGMICKDKKPKLQPKPYTFFEEKLRTERFIDIIAIEAASLEKIPLSTLSPKFS